MQGIVVDVPYGAAMRDSACVEISVVATRSPVVVFLGAMCTANDQERSGRRIVPYLSIASNSASDIASRSGTKHRGRQNTGWPSFYGCDVSY